MLLEFTVKNFKSFRDEATLSMAATSLAAMNEEVDRGARFQLEDGRSFLKSAVIYGANASGKSNAIKALALLRGMVRDSAREGQQGDALPLEPFRLSTETTSAPTTMEVVFIVGGQQFRYGVEATSTQVVREWLYRRPTKRERVVFDREGQRAAFSTAFPARALMEQTRPNALLLSVAAQFNDPIASQALAWFRRLSVLQESSERGYDVTRRCLTGELGPELGRAVREFLKQADVGIEDYEVRYENFDHLLPKSSQIRDAESPAKWFRAGRLQPATSIRIEVRTRHSVLGSDGSRVSTVDFGLESHESHGTQKIFALAGPIVQALLKGDVLVIDELDARLHPMLTRAIVDLFHRPDVNPQNAQLIFATHDVGLLDPAIFRRDQLWFVEKTTGGASALTSLAEFGGVREDESFRNQYLRGKYGALPLVRLLGEGLQNGGV